MQDFSGLISEYVHGVAQQEAAEEGQEPGVGTAAARVGAALTRSTRAGPRRSVRVAGNGATQCGALRIAAAATKRRPLWLVAAMRTPAAPA